MKNLFLLSVIFLVITTISKVQSQNLISQVDVSEIKLPEIKRTYKSNTVLNTNYIKSTRQTNISKHIEDMRLKVANFNCDESKKFKGKSEPYKVNFKSEKGNILVSFDEKGRISETEEDFENIKIPRAVRETVFKRYEKWSLTAVKFHAEYKRGEKVSNYYKVWIKNGSNKMVLKVNSIGQLL